MINYPPVKIEIVYNYCKTEGKRKAGQRICQSFIERGNRFFCFCFIVCFVCLVFFSRNVFQFIGVYV